MLYLLDTANVEFIKKAYDLYQVDGVTTNPTIISKEKRPFKDVILDIRNIIGKDSMIHVQAVSTDAEKIVREGVYLKELVDGEVYVKVPVIPQGIKAIKILSSRGIAVTATAIFTPQQALMAAKAGADFVAPYVNRLDNISADGVKVVEQITGLFKTYNLKTKVLAASFKNVEQVHKVSLVGGHGVTVNDELFEKLIEHPLTDFSVDGFINDWEGQFGKGITTLEA
jgi:fructose-6-phosphate aldolase 2